MSKNRFLSTADASRVLGVTPATIRLMVRRGDLAVSAMTEGGMHLFRRGHVERLARRRARQGVRPRPSEWNAER
jgi:hypothetical protein